MGNQEHPQRQEDLIHETEETDNSIKGRFALEEGREEIQSLELMAN
jgi:hypothetical protein